MKTLRKIISDIKGEKFGSLLGKTDVPIYDIQYNSKHVSRNSLFFALHGLKSDGNDFVEEAINRGASSVVCSQNYDIPIRYLEKVGFYVVPQISIREIMAEISASYYDYPHTTLKIIGVTGTDGKSTTVAFLYQLLTMYGFKTGYISTINFHDGKTLVSNFLRQSTPESPHIYHMLNEMRKNSCAVAIIETTSHGLDAETYRLHGISFDFGIVTNVKSEHLEYHRTIENYVKAKSNLFLKTKAIGIGIIRKEEPHIVTFHNALKYNGGRIFTYSATQEADYYAKDIRQYDTHIEGTLIFKGSRISENKEIKLYLNCLGEFNVENILAAVVVLHRMDVDIDAIDSFIPHVLPPKGRMQIVRNDLSFLPIIDYAHTPASFEKIFPLLKKICKRKLIVVFGSGGERYIEKREEQGAIADKFADIIILTNEDPRGDDPIKIIHDISRGCKNHTLGKNLFHIPSREDAIEHALSLTENNDLVAFLGKGHEQTIQMATGEIPWSEEDVVVSKIQKIFPLKTWGDSSRKK